MSLISVFRIHSNSKRQQNSKICLEIFLKIIFSRRKIFEKKNVKYRIEQNVLRLSDLREARTHVACRDARKRC